MQPKFPNISYFFDHTVRLKIEDDSKLLINKSFLCGYELFRWYFLLHVSPRKQLISLKILGGSGLKLFLV